MISAYFTCTTFAFSWSDIHFDRREVGSIGTIRSLIGLKGGGSIILVLSLSSPPSNHLGGVRAVLGGQFDHRIRVIVLVGEKSVKQSEKNSTRVLLVMYGISLQGAGRKVPNALYIKNSPQRGDMFWLNVAGPLVAKTFIYIEDKYFCRSLQNEKIAYIGKSFWYVVIYENFHSSYCFLFRCVWCTFIDSSKRKISPRLRAIKEN